MTDVYSRKVSHFRDAVDLTLAEVRYDISTSSTYVTRTETGPVPISLHLQLPRILRNIGMATQVCDLLSTYVQSRSLDHWIRKETETSLNAAYYLLRRAVLAHSQPELQPALITIVRSLSLDEVRTVGAILFCVHRLAPFNLKKVHCCVGSEEDTGEDGEMKLTPPDCWHNAERLFDLAALEKEEGVTGKMELCWTVLCRWKSRKRGTLWQIWRRAQRCLRNRVPNEVA